MGSEKYTNKLSKKGGTKMSKRLHIYLMLMFAAMLFVAGCGGSGISTVSDTEKTAKVTLNFQFPDDGGASKSLISDATTHILVNVDQWRKKKDGSLYLVNKDSKLIAKGTTNSVTLDLLPTFTNICATQWNGDPNSIYTSTKLETVCSFGKLLVGNNTVNLTMIRGEWTLSSPFAFNNATSLVSVTLKRKAYPLYEYEQHLGMNDITYSTYDDRGMAKFNYGSDYWVGLQANKPNYYGNGYYWPNIYGANSSSYGFYSNFFGPGGSSLFIAKDDSYMANNVTIPKGFVLFKLPKKTDANGIYTVSNKFIEPYNYNNYNNYNESGLALVNKTVSLQILKWDGTGYNDNQTSAILDPCAGAATDDASTITVCAGKEDSIKFGGIFSDYSGKTNSYKIIGSFYESGVDICYDNGAMPMFDDSGNLTGCYHNNAWINFNQSAGTQCIYGTWDTAKNRCEVTLIEACQQLGGMWDNVNNSCIVETNNYSGGALCSRTPAGPGMFNSYDPSSNTCYNYSIGDVECYYGNYNNQTQRCEANLETACYTKSADPGENYDATTQTCLRTAYNYVGGINFTTVTLNGVGKLSAGTGFSASKVGANTAKFKLNLLKK